MVLPGDAYFAIWTRGVLVDIGAGEVPFRVVMNKIDRLSTEARAELATRYPGAWLISTRDASDVQRVWGNVVSFFEAGYVEAEFSIPYARQALVSEFHESGRVGEVHYEEDGVRLKFRADAETLDRLRKKLG
jgi:GTP-binding protein HflX